MRRTRWVGDLAARLACFRRVIVWGHPFGHHTHSYVHAGFARALRALGAETLWTDDLRLVEGLGLARSLVITEGQVIGGLPRAPGCRYVLHNVEPGWYEEIVDQVLLLQTYTLEAARRESGSTTGERLNDYTYAGLDASGAVIVYQPWATDLLPSEFDFTSATPATGAPPYAAWVGTIGRGVFGNEDELACFRASCRQANVEFVHRQGMRLAAHRRFVARSAVAPAIVGAWQLHAGYIPCRIFKNVSYGRPGLTNSPAVAAIFEEEIACRADGNELLAVGLDLSHRRDLLARQMREVQARHTFFNRLAVIMSFLP